MAHFCAPLQALAQQHPHRVISLCGHNLCTGHHFVQRVAAFSACLCTEFGVRPGDRIALLAYNTDIMFQTLLAVMDCGAIATPLNWRWSAAELAAAIQIVLPSVIVVDAAFRSMVTDIVPECRSIKHCVLLGPVTEFENGACNWRSAEPLFKFQQDGALRLLQAADGAALICFTSGSTGQPKAVVLSHAAFWSQSLVKLATVGYSCCDSYVHLAPLFHIGGLSSAHTALVAGASHRFVPRYTVEAAIDAIGCSSAFIAVPAMLRDLADAFAHSGSGRTCLRNVKKILIGGGSMDKKLQDDVMRIFPEATVLTAYGMSEGCSSITFNLIRSGSRTTEPSSWLHGLCQMAEQRCNALEGTGVAHAAVHVRYPAASCAGWPAPGILLKLVPEPGGEVGEVMTKGSHVMNGYWGAQELTAQAVDSDGWLHTGDLGFMDDSGCLWLLGRKKDMIKSGGENVFAAEVEASLRCHPAVSDAAVVGLPDARLGEKVAALVVLNASWQWVQANVTHGTTPPQVEIVQHCRDHGLSGYKVPRIVTAQYSTLPRNSLGKVEKSKIAQHIMQLDTAYTSRL